MAKAKKVVLSDEYVESKSKEYGFVAAMWIVLGGLILCLAIVDLILGRSVSGRLVAVFVTMGFGVLCVARRDSLHENYALYRRLAERMPVE